MWKPINITKSEITLSKVLRCGQTFRWKNINNVWTFTVQDKIILLKQDDQSIHFSWIGPKGIKFDEDTIKQYDNEVKEFVYDYFNLHIKLEDLYKTWEKVEKKYRKSVKKSAFNNFLGIRVLRQDPWETVITFICSSNNNVKRISKMCDALCSNFGNFINEYNGIPHYSFPTPLQLSMHEDTEKTLRDLRFGYRAKYIYKTACKLANTSMSEINLEQLYSLRRLSYSDCIKFLLNLDGVGPKVADCICLMSLDKHEVVPVDTHVFQIAVRDFKYPQPKNFKGTLSKKIYDNIQSHYINIFGDYAGWAQSVLFTADLTDLNNGVNLVDLKASNNLTYVET